MNYNFLGLVNDTLRRLNEVELSASTFDTAVGFYSFAKDSVNSALRDVNAQSFEWPFNHDKQREHLYAGDVRYFLPRDTKTVDMDSFRIRRSEEFGNPTVKLKLISYEEYLDKYVDYEYNQDTSLRSLPRFVFRTPSFEYGVVPAPDKNYEVEYEFYRNSTDLILHSDVPTVPEDFRSVIVEGAMSQIYLFRGDTDASQISAQKFDKGIKEMRTIYTNRYEYIRDTRVKY